MSRCIALLLTLASWLVADDAHQRQVVRLGSLDQVPVKKGKHKVPKPRTAQNFTKPAERAKQAKRDQPVWGLNKNKKPRQRR